jgi:predicted nucleic-acid-binding Zn-ribbon protein
MSVNEAKKCPKCGGTMTKGKLLARENPIAHRDVVFEEAFQRKLMTEKKWIVAFACEKCGFVETYASETASLQ